MASEQKRKPTANAPGVGVQRNGLGILGLPHFTILAHEGPPKQATCCQKTVNIELTITFLLANKELAICQ